MKVIAVNGSHNPDGNTYHALKVMCEELNAQGIETEILQIGMDAVQGCIGCCHCRNEVSGLCVFDDIVNEHAERSRQPTASFLARLSTMPVFRAI